MLAIAFDMNLYKTLHKLIKQKFETLLELFFFGIKIICV